MTEKVWFLLSEGTQYPIATHADATYLQNLIERDRVSRLGAYVEWTPANQKESVRIGPLHDAEVVGL